jgi:hypothetical protein
MGDLKKGAHRGDEGFGLERFPDVAWLGDKA